ncbi:MAG: ankyrin repeat domain-containing protein [Candidatus Hydrogenedentes bacterium]|nr:ankyrin repeat domain-containing protein [Candidatus Hydrogenedentota bacterium]
MSAEAWWVLLCLAVLFASFFLFMRRWRARRGHWKSPLTAAIEAGNVMEVQRLLQDGANPYALPSAAEYSKSQPQPGESIKPPFMIALETGREDFVEVFLRYGCRMDQPVAYIQQKIDAEAFQRLMNERQDAGFYLDEVKMPWCDAARLPLGCAIEAVAKGSAPMSFLEFLIQHGADVNGVPEGAPAPLGEAIESRHSGILELLLRHGARVEPSQFYLQKMLAEPVVFDDELEEFARWLCTAVPLLVEHGAAINEPDETGWTALHYAACQGLPALTEYLLAEGASVTALNQDGHSPLDVARDALAATAPGSPRLSGFETIISLLQHAYG